MEGKYRLSIRQTGSGSMMVGFECFFCKLVCGDYFSDQPNFPLDIFEEQIKKHKCNSRKCDLCGNVCGQGNNCNNHITPGINLCNNCGCLECKKVKELILIRTDCPILEKFISDVVFKKLRYEMFLI